METETESKNNDDILIDLIISMIMAKITMDDLADTKDCMIIPVPFPKLVFDILSKTAKVTDLKKGLANIMFVVFYNAIIDCSERNYDTIMKEMSKQILSETIKNTINLN